MKQAQTTSSTGDHDDLGAGSGSVRGRSRVSRLTIAVLLALSLIATACTPEQIEGSMNQMAISFEEGGAQRSLFEAIMVVNSAIPEVGMLIGYPFGF